MRATQPGIWLLPGGLGLVLTAAMDDADEPQNCKRHLSTLIKSNRTNQEAKRKDRLQTERKRLPEEFGSDSFRASLRKRAAPFLFLTLGHRWHHYQELTMLLGKEQPSLE